jgi:hypothetical protein
MASNINFTKSYRKQNHFCFRKISYAHSFICAAESSNKDFEFHKFKLWVQYIPNNAILNKSL